MERSEELQFAIKCQVLAMVAVSCAGCVSGSGGPIGEANVSQNKPVYVQSILDAPNHDDDTNIGSGHQTRYEFEDQLVADGFQVSNSPRVTGYSIKVTYTRWEDHATQWSGESDVVEMSVKLVDDASGKTVSRAHVKVLSSWFTFVNDSPKELIPDVVERSLEELYGQ